MADGPALARAAPIRAALGRDELTITFGFHCNLACTFCLVEDALNVYGGVDLATAEALLADPRVTEGVRTILLSGGEVTIERDLLRYVELARAVPGVEHVRLQTNAIRLADVGYLERLRGAGVDQFFVSFHGATPEVCDAITQREGSFEQIVDGMRAIAASGAELMTNTVIVEANHRELAQIVDLVLPLGPTRVDFWNYLPRVDRADARGQLARVEDIRPHLMAALDRCAGRVPRVVVKHFPRCLLGRHAALQDDSQPTLLVDDAFWGPYPPYACLYEASCEHAGAEGCRGLSFAYVKRFGWAEDTLVPAGAADRSAGQERDYWSWARSGEEAPRDDRAIPIAAPDDVYRLLDLAHDVAGWEASGVALRTGVVLVELARGSERVTLELRARDDAAACFARTTSMNLTHAPVPRELEPSLRPLVREIAARVGAADRGELWDRLREITAAPVDPSLAGWLDGLPMRHLAIAKRFSAEVLRAVRARSVRPEHVEASFSTREPAFRVHVNATSGDRLASTLALARAAGIPEPVEAVIRRWLEAHDREVFVGLAAAPARTRAKLYFRAHDASGSLPELAASLGGLAGEPAVMLGADFVDALCVGLKTYRELSPAEAARVWPTSPLRSFTARRSVDGRWYRCRRARPGGDLIDESAHAEVSALSLADAALYAPDLSAALGALPPRHTRVRALSMAQPDGDRHVYVAFSAPVP